MSSNIICALYMAYVEIFTRDKKRFENNLYLLDENPLGVAALAGTSLR